MFDIIAFWVSFRAVGLSPPIAVIGLGYLIGQLGSWLPIPGGIGGVELGMAGVLILFGLPAVPTTAAVLLFRVIELWIPGLLGLIAFIQLRITLSHETKTDELHQPVAIDSPRAARCLPWRCDTQTSRRQAPVCVATANDRMLAVGGTQPGADVRDGAVSARIWNTKPRVLITASVPVRGGNAAVLSEMTAKSSWPSSRHQRPSSSV